MPRCPRGAFSRELAGTILGKAIGEFCDYKLDDSPLPMIMETKH